MARNRPSGDGIANPIELLERSKSETLPSSATFSNPLSIHDYAKQRGDSFHPRPIYVRQFVPSFYNQITRFARGCGAKPDRSIGLKGIMARCEPSGDKLQLQSGSICGRAVLFRSSRQTGTFPQYSLSDAVHADR